MTLIRFEPVPLAESLPPGYYRWSALDPSAGRLEHELYFDVVDSLAPLRTLRLPDPDRRAAWRDRAIPVKRTAMGWLTIPSAHSYPPHKPERTPRPRCLFTSFPSIYQKRDVTEYSICSRWVTAGEIEEFVESPAFDLFLENTGRDRSDKVLHRKVAGPDAPAPVDVDVAKAFCRWVGGRLPTMTELAIALDMDLLDPVPPPLTREFLSNPDLMTQEVNGTLLVYQPLGPRLLPFDLPPSRGTAPVNVSLYFRVAFTDEREP